MTHICVCCTMVAGVIMVKPGTSCTRPVHASICMYYTSTVTASRPLHPIQHNESFQAIDCTESDYQHQTNEVMWWLYACSKSTNNWYSQMHELKNKATKVWFSCLLVPHPEWETMVLLQAWRLHKAYSSERINQLQLPKRNIVYNHHS